MSEEKGIHIFPKTDFKEVPEEDRVEWTKGNLAMTCHNCGNVEVISESMEHGVQVVIPITNWHEVKLVCNKCNSAMAFHFVKATDGEVVQDVEPIDKPAMEAEVPGPSADMDKVTEATSEGPYDEKLKEELQSDMNEPQMTVDTPEGDKNELKEDSQTK